MKKNYSGNSKIGKLVLVIIMISFCFFLLSALAMEKNTKLNKDATKLSNTSNKEIVSQEGEVSTLLQSVSAESEKNKLQRMAQFIKEKKPKLFIGTQQKSRLAFCGEFMDDFINVKEVNAIEPDFVVSGTDIDIVNEEIKRKLNVKHCEDMEHGSSIPPDVNSMLYRRGTLGFNYIGDLGGPPYRVYKLRLNSKDKVKHTIIYYDAGKNNEHVHTGFARLDLKKCRIEDEKPGYSEMEYTRSSNFHEIGRNVLVRYKEQVFALMLEYGSNMGGDYYRLRLERLSIPTTKGFVCHWDYRSRGN